MIISKPRGNTLFALSMFLLICFGLLGYTAYNFFTYEQRFWYQYVIFLIITPIAFFVLWKTVLSYKIIRLGKGKMSVKYPFFFKEKVFYMKDLGNWKEEIIKTQGTAFRELQLNFKNGKVGLSSQENGEYNKIHAYVKTKHQKNYR